MQERTKNEPERQASDTAPIAARDVAVVQIGTLTDTPTMHRIGPPFEEVLGDEELAHLLLPLVSLDGEAFGFPGTIPIVYCEYTDSSQSGLRFRRDARGIFRITDESRARLLEWERELTAMRCDTAVDRDAPFKGRFIEMQTREIEVVRRDGRYTYSGFSRYRTPLLVAREPQWLQQDQTPKADTPPLRFFGQAMPPEFTDHSADFSTYVFIDASASEIVFVWQNS